MGVNGGGATKVEESLKKALDEIAIFKAEIARLKVEKCPT
jgi:uncharacterized small protein (DUF1192 family)